MPFMAWIRAVLLTSKGFSQENKLRQLKDISNFWAKAQEIPKRPTTAMNGGVSHLQNKNTLCIFTQSLKPGSSLMAKSRIIRVKTEK